MVLFSAMTFFSVFWVFGMHFMIPIGFSLWGYMVVRDLDNLKIVYDNFGTREGERLSLEWWAIESLLMWDFGTLAAVNIMWVSSMIPVVGPILNADRKSVV